tara:strand:+ start:109 stop:897 length:789 start_codon:yes stop_codon:yes gene_type:complete
MKNLNILIVSQEDSLEIPKNIFLISKMKNINVIGVVNLKNKGAIHSKKTLFLRGFGILQSYKLAKILIINKIINCFDFFFNFKLNFLKSLKAVTKYINSKYILTNDVNSNNFLNFVKKHNIDLIVSFSAPCVFNTDLLKLPKYGCINLHCSLLPLYSGLLPSFWTLYEKQKELGATVHRMDDKIDNGCILGQVKIQVPKDPSMFKVIQVTKEIGGKLMVEVIQKILDGNVVEIKNQFNKKNYRSWPNVSQIKEFKSSGGKLI